MTFMELTIDFLNLNVQYFCAVFVEMTGFSKISSAIFVKLFDLKM